MLPSGLLSSFFQNDLNWFLGNEKVQGFLLYCQVKARFFHQIYQRKIPFQLATRYLLLRYNDCSKAEMLIFWLFEMEALTQPN